MTDYSLLEPNSGCCLHCSDSHDGCLCYECKCTICECYIPPEENDGYKGRCGKVEYLREERKSRFIESIRRNQERRYLNKLKLDKINDERLKLIKENKEIPFYYTCQECFNIFVTNDELTIKRGVGPLCPICDNGRRN